MTFNYKLLTTKAVGQALFQALGLYIAASLAGLPPNLIWASALFGLLGGSFQDIMGFRLQLKQVPPAEPQPVSPAVKGEPGP